MNFSRGPKYNIRIATEFCCNGVFFHYICWHLFNSPVVWHRTFKQIGPEAFENWETGFIFDLEQCTYFFPGWATVLKVASSWIHPVRTPWGNTRPRSPTQSHSNLKKVKWNYGGIPLPLKCKMNYCNMQHNYVLLVCTYSSQHAK